MVTSFSSFKCVSVPTVKPPTNLTLDCRNLHNVLKWSYEEPLTPGLTFIVTIGCISSCPENFTVDPPALQADLSFLSQPGEEYYVTVRAVIGKNKSESPEGIEFTYFKDSLVSNKCVVDLPSVNVTAKKDDMVLLRFVHPWLFHKEKMAGSPTSGSKKKRSHVAEIEQLPEFTYDVVIMNQKAEPHGFSCEKRVCEQTLPVDAAQEKHCLKITGEMKRMSVEATQDYCALPIEETANYFIYIVVVGVLLLIALIAILFMVYKKKTKPSSSTPNSINITGRRGPLTLGVDPEHVIVPQVEPHSPTPLLHSTDEPPVTIPDFNERLRIGVSTEDEAVCEDEEVQNDEGSEYAQGGQLEDDTFNCREITSNYESRNPVVVVLAPGEVAEGYRN
ncbi:growth/differentiation factor 10b [Tautogolabrus adspersus]